MVPHVRSNWKFISDGYDYGIGCNLGCKCPSFVDVCATSPRIGKASDLKEPQTRFSVAQLGYCRTGRGVEAVNDVNGLDKFKRYIGKGNSWEDTLEMTLVSNC